MSLIISVHLVALRGPGVEKLISNDLTPGNALTVMIDEDPILVPEVS